MKPRRIYGRLSPHEDGWKIISVIGGRGDLETLLSDELNRAGIVIDQTKFGKDNLQGYKNISYQS